MKKLIAVGIVLLSATAVFAEEAKPKKAPPTPEEIAMRKQKFYTRTGGFIRNPKSGAGKVVFINAQKKFTNAPLENLAERLGKKWRLTYEVVSSDPIPFKDVAKTREKFGAGSAVVVTELDPNQPALIVLPDERCSFVNTAAFPSDASEELLRKEVVRGYAACSGALISQYGQGLMNSFDNLKLLNAYKNDEIQADVGIKVVTELGNHGVKPYKVATYLKACQEGWAPAPTNDIEKAIMKRAQEMPKNPMKIEFDPAKGR